MHILLSIQTVNQYIHRKCQKPALHCVSVRNNKSDICLLSDIFSQISDSSGVMMFAKFDQFLREVLKLPTAVFEGPSFGYTEHSVRTCFPQQVWEDILSSFKSLNNLHVLFNTCLCVFVSRRRSCWTPFWMCWWQILHLNASYGYRSCTDLLMLKMVRSGLSDIYIHIVHPHWNFNITVPHVISLNLKL